jgi:hypothetical protein
MSGVQLAMASMGFISSAMPSVQTQIIQNQLATRAGFFGYGSGNKDARYDQVQALQLAALRGGTATSTLDPSFAMASGQSAGIGTGLRNYNSLFAGVQNMSNTVPGLGLEGTMQAYAGLQQGRSVNIMRAMGISARDAQGNPKSYTDIANQIWSKLNREKSVGRAITKEDIANGLLPGSSLDSMLNQIAGSNEALRLQLEAALYAKAGGAKDFSKTELNRVGGMSDYTVAASNRVAASGETLFGTSRAGAAGAEAGAITAATISQFSNALNNAIPVLSAIAGVKGFVETAGGMGNGFLEKIAGSGIVQSILGRLPGRAGGGDVGGSNAYIVGEKGPELFVPKSDGTVIPNHKLKFSGFRHHGGSVKGGETESSMRGYLAEAGFTGAGLENALRIAKAESNWRSKAQGDTTINTEKWGNSVGLFQIRSLKNSSADYYPERNAQDLLDPLFNAKAAFKISKGGTNWNPWSVAAGLGLAKGGSGGSGGGANTYSAEGIADLDSLRNVMSAYSSGGRGGGTVNNMGGVTINIVGSTDPKKTAEAVKRILTEEGTLKKASSS